MLGTKAFSLLELLVVMGIVAILISGAVPAYNKYLIKAQVMQILSIADAYKLTLFDSPKATYQINSELVDYVVVDTLDTMPAKHVIHVAAKIPAGLVLQLHGINQSEMLKWSCHVGAEHNQYVPSICRNNNLEKINVG